MNNKTKTNKVIVRIAEDEQVLIVKKNSFYKLGNQHNDIVHSDALLEARHYDWCHISQEFMEVKE